MIYWLEKINALGIQQIKVKVGQGKDLATLTLVREILGDQVDIRLDANRAWSFEQALEVIPQLEKFGISGIEEPLQGTEVEQLPRLARYIQTPLILDESVIHLADAQYYADRIPASQLIYNLKISKCGGFYGASEIHQFAQHRGISCQLGCNVGETAILSAAGRHFAATHSLKYLEGSYGAFFMEGDLSQNSINFGHLGEWKALKLPGLGVEVAPSKLDNYSKDAIVVGPTSSKVWNLTRKPVLSDR